MNNRQNNHLFKLIEYHEKEELIQKAYEIAVERYAAVGVDTEKVLKTMQDFHLSLHCWQADDVAGFEVQAGSLTGRYSGNR